MFGYVFYPDGGCREHEPSYTGGGIHGYKWNLGLPAKGIGHTTHSATFRGYDFKADTFDFESKELRAAVNAYSSQDFMDWCDIVSTQPKTPRTDKEKESKKTPFLTNLDTRVTVEQYYDRSIPFNHNGTNNTAELLAAIHCLEMIEKEPDFDKASLVVVRQDNMYVVDGHNLGMHGWIANGFKRRDGSDIKNPDLWIRLCDVSTRIQKLGVRVLFQWVKAHHTDIGNNSADLLATMGLFNSKSVEKTISADTSLKITEPTGYWASRTDAKHPMLCLRYCFIDINEPAQPVHQYYLSTQGKIAEMTGKRTSDDGYSVIRCASQPHIDQIIAKQLTIPRTVDYMFNVDLEAVYGTECRYVDMYGTDFLHRARSYNRHLTTYGDKLVTEELHPPFLTQRLFNNMDVLSTFLEEYKDGTSPAFMSKEITDIFYNTVTESVKVKKGEDPQSKTVTSLKEEFVVGSFKLQTSAAWKEAPDTVSQCDITLRLGIDLPDRNTLRKLEDYNPKVYLVTNTLGPGSFMYSVVIEAGTDVGIWSGINSSIRVIAAKPIKADKKKPAA